MSACLLLCTSCAAPDPFEAFSPEAPNDKARYFRKDLMKALYVNPPWGAPHSMPLPPCHADNFRPKEIIRCYSLSPDYLHEIMKVFEVTPSKLIKEEKKTTYVYDLSSKKCPLVIVREEELGEKSWIEQTMDTFQLKVGHPSLLAFFFIKMHWETVPSFGVCWAISNNPEALKKIIQKPNSAKSQKMPQQRNVKSILPSNICIILGILLKKSPFLLTQLSTATKDIFLTNVVTALKLR